MAYYSNMHRQIVTYRESMSESFSRLDDHLRADSFVDTEEITRIASNIGKTDMDISNIQNAIARCTQTVIIAESLKQALKLEMKYQLATTEVRVIRF